MHLFLALLLGFASLGAAGELVGQRAPGFALPDLAGKFYDPADYRGKLLLVDFMQVTCPHCATFAKILEKAKAKYGDRIAVLSVVNPPSDKAGVSKFLQDHKITSPILFDCGQVAYSYIRPKSTSISIPHVFFIDGEGVIRNDIVYSPQTQHIFEGNGLFAEIDKLLKPASPAKR
jgi:peroxiredoxin